MYLQCRFEDLKKQGNLNSWRRDKTYLQVRSRSAILRNFMIYVCVNLEMLQSAVTVAEILKKIPCDILFYLINLFQRWGFFICLTIRVEF